jgi:hypothetical protein
MHASSLVYLHHQGNEASHYRGSIRQKCRLQTDFGSAIYGPHASGRHIGTLDSRLAPRPALSRSDVKAEKLQCGGVKFLTFLMAARSCTTPFLTSSLASVSFLCTAISACPLRVHAFGETCGCRLSGLKDRGTCRSVAAISQDAPTDF